MGKTSFALLGCDTGGTFTDFVVRRGGRVFCFKEHSNPSDPAAAIQNGLKRGGVSSFFMAHGTTVCTNAVLEGRGGKVLLCLTKGFRDLLHLGRQNRTEVYTLTPHKIAIPISKRNIVEVRERIAADGTILLPLTQEEIKRISQKIAQINPEAVALCFLHAYVNDKHEQLLARALRSTGVSVTCSSEVLPMEREYERGVATLLNAFLLPVMERYAERLACLGGEVQVVHSAAGRMSLQEAREFPVRTLFSGPAAGVIGAQIVSQSVGIEKILTFDMGGTSTDVSLCEGEAEVWEQGSIAELPLATPHLAIHTIGAGGGSIVHLDRAGALHVGPASAGAVPGPACYGKGRELTLTDAQLLLGRIQPDLFLGGEMLLSEKRANTLLTRKSREWGIDRKSILKVALELVETNMERALRRVSVEKGHDPREFSLISFGGNGPLYAVALARRLQMQRVLVPVQPGVLSAYGCIVAPYRRDASIAVHLPMEEFQKTARQWQKKLLRKLKPLLEKSMVSFYVDCRYEGQSYDLTVPLTKSLAKQFQRLHKQRYHFLSQGKRIIVTHCHVVVQRRTRRFALEGRGEVRRAEKRVCFVEKKWVRIPFILREGLCLGEVVRGPAVLFEYSSTIYLPPGAKGEVVKHGHFLIDV